MHNTACLMLDFVTGKNIVRGLMQKNTVPLFASLIFIQMWCVFSGHYFLIHQGF